MTYGPNTVEMVFFSCWALNVSSAFLRSAIFGVFELVRSVHRSANATSRHHLDRCVTLSILGVVLTDNNILHCIFFGLICLQVSILNLNAKLIYVWCQRISDKTNLCVNRSAVPSVKVIFGKVCQKALSFSLVNAFIMVCRITFDN